MFLDKKYEDFYKKVKENIEIEAVIISSPKENEYYNTYTIKGKTEEFKNKKFILYVKKDVKLEYGDKIKIIGEFYEPDGSRNYKGFNYKEYLKTEKIYGTIKTEKIEFESKNNGACTKRRQHIYVTYISKMTKGGSPQQICQRVQLLAAPKLSGHTYI